MKSLLIANRGEIAVRIARAAAQMNIRTVSVHSEDDALSLHSRSTDESRALTGIGPAAYLDMSQIVQLARDAECDAIHPGYGFLSENSAFATACSRGGLIFVGPTPETLDAFGNKATARAMAASCGVPTMRGTSRATSLDEAREFFATLQGGGIMIKAIAGGGGRGMRPVKSVDELERAYHLCKSEALKSFGNDEVYVEQLFPHAKHIEVQVIGDGTGAVSHIWERECSLQRHRQKLIEIAPAPGLAQGLRTRLLNAAVKLAKAVKYRGLGTFEFLIDMDDTSNEADFAFIEANARLQVEHTVTEEVTGIDLVRAQLDIARGRSLIELGLEQNDILKPRGVAIQARVNMETMGPNNTIRPSGGLITTFEPPTGQGVRVDSFGYAGYQTNPRFDSLLAKVIVHSDSSDLCTAADKIDRALSQFRIVGVSTNIAFLQALVRHPGFRSGTIHTQFVEEQISDLLEQMTR